MKRVFEQNDKPKLIHKLHQLQKRLTRAEQKDHSPEKVEKRIKILKKIQEQLRHIKGDKK